MTDDAFDPLPEAYEAMIDWPKRLANEEPLYRWLFDRVNANRLLDTACGTGHHAAMFHNWGLSVEAADISEPMIRWCRSHHTSAADLRWVVRGYDKTVDEPGTFDVAICAGNSLALAGDLAGVARAIQQMLVAVRPGGAILTHVVNLWRMPDGPCQWQKCLRTDLSQGDSLIVKGIHRCGRQGHVDVVVTALGEPKPKMHAESVPFLGLEPKQLEAAAKDAGASQVEFYGGYKRSPYDPQISPDLIMIATR